MYSAEVHGDIISSMSSHLQGPSGARERHSCIRVSDICLLTMFHSLVRLLKCKLASVTLGVKRSSGFHWLLFLLPAEKFALYNSRHSCESRWWVYPSTCRSCQLPARASAARMRPSTWYDSLDENTSNWVFEKVPDPFSQYPTKNNQSFGFEIASPWECAIATLIEQSIYLNVAITTRYTITSEISKGRCIGS